MYKLLSPSMITSLLAISAGLLWATANTNPAKIGETTELKSAGEYQVSSETAFRLTIAPDGNTARYLVREQLAGFDFPNDAVGETHEVSGSVGFNVDGEVVAEESSIVVNITGLTSDRDRRDGFIQRRTLEGETYPTVELVPIQTRGLEFPLPENSTLTFDIVGYLTVRDVTEVTSWRVTAQFNDGSLTGTARTEFTFDEFGMEKPSVGSVLSVADAIRLELDFIMIVENLVSL